MAIQPSALVGGLGLVGDSVTRPGLPGGRIAGESGQ